ncbi:hypothetical protein BC938DRAFT_475521 [Jimgerdemannia flammicorona]|uniref:Uncharacterized protein n=1 Tax=Jimgerdemannia flammicorona TaxID=994334 RepID=A0A433PT14_9FUNG|nr:hypothetical protein BC938DRAFT_475521 [Jimgerdemannia flammicorona]
MTQVANILTTDEYKDVDCPQCQRSERHKCCHRHSRSLPGAWLLERFHDKELMLYSNTTLDLHIYFKWNGGPPTLTSRPAR